MLELHIDVKKNICNISQPPLTSGCVNAVACFFKFDKSWDGYTKIASFECKVGVFHVMVADDMCMVPHTVLENTSYANIGIVGIKNDVTVTTNKVRFHIIEGANKNGIKDPDYQPTLIEQLVTLTKQAQEAAQSVYKDAAAGKFNGKDGVSCSHNWNDTTLTITSASGTSSADLRGPQGLPGATPQRGVDYWTPEDEAIILGFIEQHADSALSTRVKDGILYVQTIPSIKAEVKDNVLFINQGD